MPRRHERRAVGLGPRPFSLCLYIPFLLGSLQLAVEALDQALAVLVGLLVAPEVTDLLVAQTVEPRGDLLNVLLVVVGDGERDGLDGPLGVPDAGLDEPHALPLEGEHEVVAHTRKREVHRRNVAPLPEERAIDFSLLLCLAE